MLFGSASIIVKQYKANLTVVARVAIKHVEEKSQLAGKADLTVASMALDSSAERVHEVQDLCIRNALAPARQGQQKPQREYVSPVRARKVNKLQ
jgi:hypothetical protein